jgi:1,4-dihydroxy-2-naphthoate octaprenyltransferase
MPPQEITPFKVWIMAARPLTLPAAAAPVIVGTAIAIADNSFALLPALAALIGALLLQIGVNLANDYFDHIKGIDTADRVGPIRVTQSGLIPVDRVRAGMIVTFCSAAAVGVYLVTVAGWPILLAGLASILAALAYSGGPFPLASHGFGDLFVFIFFGMVAVCGTYYVQALNLTLLAVLASVPVGLLITAILVVNNLRDIDTDHKAGKFTLAVIIGSRWTKLEYVLLLATAYTMPAVIWSTGLVSKWVFLPLVSLPVAFPLIRTIRHSAGVNLNKALAGTAALALLFSLLLSMGFVLTS